MEDGSRHLHQRREPSTEAAQEDKASLQTRHPYALNHVLPAPSSSRTVRPNPMHYGLKKRRKRRDNKTPPPQTTSSNATPASAKRVLPGSEPAWTCTEPATTHPPPPTTITQPTPKTESTSQPSPSQVPNPAASTAPAASPPKKSSSHKNGPTKSPAAGAQVPTAEHPCAVSRSTRNGISTCMIGRIGIFMVIILLDELIIRRRCTRLVCRGPGRSPGIGGNGRLSC